MKDPYSGFAPDRRPRAIIGGAGIIFFATSCALALGLFPSLFTSSEFLVTEQYRYVNPTSTQLQDIAGLASTHLAWTLAPFLVAGYVFRRRKLAIIGACILLVCGAWLFGAMPFSSPARVLIMLLWSLATVGIIAYRQEFD